ncbi:MAG: sodium-dependent bicarbonate transport family permease [Planctomycetes bacterium]|nr:sodium-dependent bicarbonate transport family permease [Planctomycetota bacterium]
MDLHEFLHKVVHNLFQPLLLFFYMGVLIPILRVGFEFPHQVYQGLVVFLLLSIGWHGGEELAKLQAHELYQALGFMVVGFVLNFIIGIIAYAILRVVTRLRRVDAATVAAYYGSDSAGTFATCIGTLGGLQVATLAAALMASQVPMERLGLGKDVDFKKVKAAAADPVIVERWKQEGVDVASVQAAVAKGNDYVEAPYMPVMLAIMEIPGCLVGLYLVARCRRTGMDKLGNMPDEPGYNPTALAHASGVLHGQEHGHGEHVSVESSDPTPKKSESIFSASLLHEVFLNTGIYLLFGAIAIGFIGQMQGSSVVAKDDPFFLNMFHGVLCMYLLEMGITAAKRFADLRVAGIKFILFGMLAPNLFATIGILVAHGYSHLSGAEFSTGTYMVFAVLCGASSYIAVPAIQRLAIPEASPTLPLAASLGLTFSYNVTIGITVYEYIALALKAALPV